VFGADGDGLIEEMKAVSSRCQPVVAYLGQVNEDVLITPCTSATRR